MKKIILLLSLLILVGGGCTSNQINSEQKQQNIDEQKQKVEKIEETIEKEGEKIIEEKQNNNTQSQEVHRSISEKEQAERNKSCTLTHGPSVYKELPKSVGGGSFCDCVEGYTWNPLILKCIEGIYIMEEITKSKYNCSTNSYDCSNFKTHNEAQACYEYCGGVNNDIHQLDEDKDGFACKTLL